MAAEANKYKIMLNELEGSVRVPASEQSMSQPEPPPADPLSAYEANEGRLLINPAGSGRLSP